MEKIKYLPLGLFIAAVIKSLISPSNFVDVSLILVLGLIASFYEFKVQEKKYSDLQKQLDLINKDLNSIKEINDELKSYISGIKLNQQMRGQLNVNNNR